MTGSVRVIILAGGQGSRFWPVSRVARPKQFLSISDTGESLLQATARRVSSLVDAKDIWVLSNDKLRPLVEEHLPSVRVLCEPIARNTAAGIGLAAVYVMMEDPEAVMVVLPADHAVSNEAKLLEALRAAMSIAAGSDLLVTVGIPPSHAHTGYGYIKRGAEIAPGAFRVDRFFEKPNLERAQKYCESGEFYWNSGMFVWKARCILDSIRQFLPDMHTALMQIGTLLGKGSRGSEDNVALIDHLFREMESISIDFGVLEHARNCAVVAAPDFGWNDVGSWDQWAEHFGHDQAGNLIHGDAVAIDSKTCVVHSQKRFTAIVGLEDVIVIDAGDALLVCARESVQDVRKVVEELKRRGRSDLV